MAKDSGDTTEDYNPADTGNTLGNTLDSYADQVAAGETPVYGSDLYADMGSTTWNALLGSYDESWNQDYWDGTQNALAYYSDVASGNYYGTDDPGYATLRQDTIDDTMAAVNTTFNDSGRFGSGSHVNSAAQGVGSAIAELDYTNYLNDRQYQLDATNMLGTLYDLRQKPYDTQLEVGQAIDADTQAALLADYDLWGRTNDADYTRLSELISLLGGSSDTAGMTEDADFFDYLSTLAQFF